MALLPMFATTRYPANMRSPLANNAGPFWNIGYNPGTPNAGFFFVAPPAPDPVHPTWAPFSLPAVPIRWGKSRGFLQGATRPA